MIYRFCLLLFHFLFLQGNTKGQDIERKIIIQGGRYYFTTVDPELQLATLHVGDTSSTISEAHDYTLPAGRSLMEPVNPFVWDISGDHLWVINFMDNPMNDKGQALKKIPISSLKEKEEKTNFAKLIDEGINMSPFASNDPYLNLLNHSPVMNNFFFDAVALNDSLYSMAISNNGEITFWNYNGKNWKMGKNQKLAINSYFSLFYSGKTLYLIVSDGRLFKVTGDALTSVKQENMNNSLLILDKDRKKVLLLKRKDLNSELSLRKLIEKKAVPIIN